MAELLHDLAPELELLRAYAERASEEGREGRIAHRELEELRAGAQDATALLHDVLDHLHGRRAAPDDGFAPRETAERLVRSLVPRLPAVEIELVSRLPRDARVAGRRSWYRRAIHNLLRNAAIHARSRVVVSLDPLDDGQIRLSVEDDGPGWEAPAVEGGYGLGLTSARWAAEVLGGALEILPPGELGGARVALTLPLARTRVGERQAARLEGVRVAVIDDNAWIADLLARTLSRVGAKVERVPLPVPDGWPGRALPDVVLLDLHLGAEDGRRVYRERLSAVPGLAERVVFLTGDVYAAELEGRPVLCKPIDTPHLVEVLREVAEGSVR